VDRAAGGDARAEGDVKALAAAALLLILAGCAALPAILVTTASVASAGYTIVHSALQVGEDILAAVAISCQALPAATAAERARKGAAADQPTASAIPWYSALCNDLRPSNPNLDAGSPAWVAAGLAKIGG
jgi:hypothetical protein